MVSQRDGQVGCSRKEEVTYSWATEPELRMGKTGISIGYEKRRVGFWFSIWKG